MAPPLAAPAIPPSPDDIANFKEERGLDEVGFSEFTKGGVWDADDVLEPIYKEASEVMGRQFPYPKKK
ncbi:MAG: hypothetical protein AAGD22_13510 [Verrucomicrobiota bacterium]